LCEKRESGGPDSKIQALSLRESLFKDLKIERSCRITQASIFKSLNNKVRRRRRTL
jgi:hypothetical protein